MLYQDFIDTGITMVELDVMMSFALAAGYEMEEYKGTLAYRDNTGNYVAVGVNAIITLIKNSNMQAFDLGANFLKDLYAKVA